MTIDTDIARKVLFKEPLQEFFLFYEDPEEPLDILLETMSNMEDMENDPYLLSIVEEIYQGPFTFQPVSIGNRTRRIECRNRVGIPAGFLKEPLGLQLVNAMGVGSIELGSVVPEYQYGNRKQRFFVAYDAGKEVWIVRNAFGFNSSGAKSVVQPVRQLFDTHGYDAIGASIFWSLSPNRKTMDQYQMSYNFGLIADDILYCVAHILPILRENDALQFNIASPNTPHLRELFLHFRELFALIIQGSRDLARWFRMSSPSWIIKLSPDMSLDEMQEVVEATCEFEEAIAVEGFNTTIDGEIWRQYDIAPGPGGVSGGPLREPAYEKMAALYGVAETEGYDVDFISVGGIGGPSDAVKRLQIGPRIKQVQFFSEILNKGFGLIPDTLETIAVA